ncbi:hypothetical protein D9M70_471040 [compost metagenome]
MHAHGLDHRGVAAFLREQCLLDQLAELLAVTCGTDLQAFIDQLDAVLLVQKTLGEAVFLQDLAILVEDDGAHGQLVDGAGVEVALAFHAIEVHVQHHGLLEMGRQQGQQVLVVLVEGGIVFAARDADAALRTVAGVDVRTQDVEHVYRFEKVLVELRIQPVTIRNELGQGDHLAVGQPDEGVQAVEVLVIGRRDLGGRAFGADAQSIHMLAGWPQDEGGVLGCEDFFQLIEERRPGDVLQRSLIEVAKHPAELVERESVCHV